MGGRERTRQEGALRKGDLFLLQARVGDPRVSLEMYRNLENHVSLNTKQAEPGQAKNAGPDLSEILGVPQAPQLAEIILAQAEQQERLGRWGDAALTYERAIGSGKGGSQAEYGYARALLNAGTAAGREKALDLLEKLAAKQAQPPTEAPAQGGVPARATVSKESSNDFWARLARQKLADERKREPSGARSP